MEPIAGIEPATYPLPWDCSTTEPYRRDRNKEENNDDNTSSNEEFSLGCGLERKCCDNRKECEGEYPENHHVWCIKAVTVYSFLGEFKVKLERLLHFFALIIRS